MKRENEHIRRAARIAGIPLWKVAAVLSISEPTLTRWLRFPLSKEKEDLVNEALLKLINEEGDLVCQK